MSGETKHSTFDCEVWRMRQLVQVLNLSRSRIYEMVQTGEFPPPFLLSTRASAWPAAQVRDWLNERQAQGRKIPGHGRLPHRSFRERRSVKGHGYANAGSADGVASDPGAEQTL